MKAYRMYGKEKPQDKFKPLNLREMRFVGNLIYASILPEDQAKSLESELNELNPSMTFEARYTGEDWIN